MSPDEEQEVAVEQEAPPEEPQAEAPAAADEQAAAKEAAKFDKDAPFEPANLIADFAQMESDMKATEAEIAKRLQVRKGGEALGRAVALSAMMEAVKQIVLEVTKSLLEEDLNQEDLQARKKDLTGLMKEVKKLQQLQKEFQGAVILYEEKPDKLQEETDRIADNMEQTMTDIILENPMDSKTAYDLFGKNQALFETMINDRKARQAARKSKT